MARPILNRRQLLSAILVTGAAGGAGLATAGPAFAAPPAGWRLLRHEESPVTTDGVVNHQALLGVWADGSALTKDRLYWGVRLHNTSRQTTTLQYQHLRTSVLMYTTIGYTDVADGTRTWTLRPDERKVVWFGGSEDLRSGNIASSEGRTQSGNRGWGRWSSAVLIT